jgi:hypothetical protein
VRPLHTIAGCPSPKLVVETIQRYYLRVFLIKEGTVHEKNFTGLCHSARISNLRIFSSAPFRFAMAEPTRFDVGGIFCGSLRTIPGHVHKPGTRLSVQRNTLSGHGNRQECCGGFRGDVCSMHFPHDLVWHGNRQYDENELDSYLLPPERPAANSSRNRRLHPATLMPLDRQLAIMRSRSDPQVA